MVVSDLPPPGWYREGDNLRWWDGQNWGPLAPQPPVHRDEDDKTLAVVAHAGALAGGVILPLIVYLMSRSKPRDAFGRHHAAEALNFQLTVLVATLVPLVVVIPVSIGVAVAVGAGGSSGPPVGLLVVMVLFGIVAMVVGIGSLILGIMGMIKASQLERWRYPICLRFVDRQPADA